MLAAGAAGARPEPLVSKVPYGTAMARRRLAGLRARPGWPQPRVVVPRVAALAAVMIGVVLLSGPARDAGTPGRVPAASTASWNTADTAYVQAMLWQQQQAQHLASLVEGRTTRPELLRLALGIRTAQSSDLSGMAAWLPARW
jgi:hypothetical protein